MQQENAELKAQLAPRKVYNCTYPAQMMALAVFVVLNGGSLRCAAATAGFYAQLMGWDYRTPAFKTVSNWVERCGLYALNLTKTLKGEYVAITDASIQIGKEQLLLLLGVPSTLVASMDRPLRITDVEVLGMEVQSSWTGEYIKEFVEKTLRRCGGVRLGYMISDQGTNIMAAMRRLDLEVVNDCSHIMMNVVKGLFKDDEQLKSLCSAVGRLRQSWTLTDYAYLLPPSLRDKDRFLRIFTLVQWIERIDSYREKLPKALLVQLDRGRSRWLDLRLRQVQELLVITAKILKYDGLSAASYDTWINAVIGFVERHPQMTQQAKDFIEAMFAYFDAYQTSYQGDLKLLCCSDIIESIFGRYKNKGGMKAISADVLSIALYNQPINVEFVQTAMQQVSGPQVDKWRTDNVCHNRYGIRKRMEKELENAG